jgi:hypothetical protein
MTQVSGMVYDSVSDLLVIQSLQSSDDVIQLDWGLEALVTQNPWKRLTVENNAKDAVFLIENDRYQS